jgi:hypothetical protein
VLSIPLLVLAADRGSGQLFWVLPFSLDIGGQAGLALLSTGMPPNFHSTSTTLAATIVTGVALLVAVVVAARVAVPRWRRPSSWPLLCVLSWLVIPTVVTMLLYLVGEPIELARVTILVLAPVALLLAWLLLRPEVQPALGVAGVAVLLVLRLLQLVPSYGTSPEPWNAVTAYVLSSTSPASPACVVFYPQDGREPFDYYLRAASPAVTNPGTDLHPILPNLGWGTVRPFVESYGTLGAASLAGIAANCPRVWLIASHQGQAAGTLQSRLNLRRYQAIEAELAKVYRRSTERQFGWSASVDVQQFHN